MMNIPRGYNHHYNYSNQTQHHPPPLVNLSQNSNSSASSLASSNQTYSHQPFNQYLQSQGELLSSLQRWLASLETNHTELADQVTTFQQQTQTNHNQILNLLQQHINTTTTNQHNNNKYWHHTHSNNTTSTNTNLPATNNNSFFLAWSSAKHSTYNRHNICGYQQTSWLKTTSTHQNYTQRVRRVDHHS